MSVGLPTTGELSFSAIRSEMGQAGAEVRYSTLYRNAGYTPSTATSVPTTGQISLTNFLGASKWNYTNCNYQVSEVPLFYGGVNDVNAKTIWVDPHQHLINAIESFSINFQSIYRNTTTSAISAKIFLQADNVTTVKVNETNPITFNYDGTGKEYPVTLPIGANLISFSNTRNGLSSSFSGNPGGLVMTLRNSANTQTLLLSSASTFRANTQAVVHPGNYSTVMDKVDGGTFSIAFTGTSPNVETQLNSSSHNGNVTLLHATQRLQDFPDVVAIAFEYKIPTTANADALWFFMGSTDNPGSEIDHKSGFIVNIQVWHAQSVYNNQRGIFLYDGTVRGSSIFDPRNNDWQRLIIAYQKSTGIFAVQLNGTDIITYTNPNNSTWLTNSGSKWGFGTRTGGSTGDFYIRRVTVYGR